MHQTASLTVSGYVDLHWRGAYDILVRPGGTRLNLEQTHGLVEPNFLGFAGAGGISVDQVAAIKSLPGVQLAAPVGFVGYLHETAAVPTVWLDHLPAKPTLFRLTLTTTTTDGLSWLPVQSETGYVLIGPPSPGPDPTAEWASTFGTITAGQTSDGKWRIAIAPSHALPDLQIPIVAVDPEAEAELLGSGASYLGSLGGIHTGQRKAGTFDIGQVAPAYPIARTSLQVIQSPNWPTPSDKELAVIPLVVSTKQAAKLNTILQVDQIGQPMDSYPDADQDLQELADRAGSSPVGSVTTDVSTTLAPMAETQVCLVWPGSTTPCETSTASMSSSLDSRLAGRPSYTSLTQQGKDPTLPRFSITQAGIVKADGNPATPAGGLDTGLFAAYRHLEEVPLAVSGSGFKPHGRISQPFFLIPVGAFDATAVNVPTDPLDYVPLGTWDPADTTYIADAAGTAVSPKGMDYPLVPNGLVTTPPLAITDIRGAQDLRGDSPVDAVRVRVSGVTNFGPEGRAKIQKVADAIARLGFDVDIVAGSSPQNVDIYVPKYHIDAGGQTDLGWVRQHWTTMGAALQVTSGFDSSDAALLLLSIVSAIVWSFALAGLRSERRIQDASVLVAMGWSRRERLGWLLGESMLASIVIACLALAGMKLGGGGFEGLAVGLAMAVIWLVAGALSALQAMHFARADLQVRRVGQHRLAAVLPADGLLRYEARATFARWPWVVITAVGLAAGAASISLGVAIVAGLSERIGPTLLASATGAVAAAFQPLMLAAIGAGSLTFVVAGLRINRRQRAVEALILSASGWSHREVRALGWLSLVPIAVLAGMLAVAAVTLAAPPLRVSHAEWPAVLAAILSVSVVAWGRLATSGIDASAGEVR